MNLIDDVAVIIRSTGERTEKACFNLLAQQVKPANIFIVIECPFSAALRKSFQVGIQQNLRWTACVDADVLLKDDAIAVLKNIAEKEDDSLYMLESYVLDKFFGGPVPKGCHWYPTKLLLEALPLIPTETETNRPETFVLSKMRERGYSYVPNKAVLGLHDYEQSYRDIYRKIFLHARKHRVITVCLSNYWRRMSKTDKDFTIALDALQKTRVINISSPLNAQTFNDDLATHGISCQSEEKRILDEQLITYKWIDNILATNIPPREYKQCMRSTNNGLRSSIWPALAQARNIKQEEGTVAMLRWLATRLHH